MMAAASVEKHVKTWRYTDIVSALRQHGPEFLTDQFLCAVIALVERERFDGDDLLEASADDAVLSASWLPPVSNASQTRVRFGIMNFPPQTCASTTLLYDCLTAVCSAMLAKNAQAYQLNCCSAFFTKLC